MTISDENRPLCECGCGNLVSKKTRNKKYYRFIIGHSGNQKIKLKEAIEKNWYKPNTNKGLCHCGCNQKTPLARQSNKKLGWVKDMPIRFICGHHITEKIPEPNTSGICQCGCGGRTPLAKQTSKAANTVKNKPLRFIKGHRKHLDLPSPEQALKEGWYKPNIKNGLCYCGCGKKTSIASITNRKGGNLQGQHQRFIKGHNMDELLTHDKRKEWSLKGSKAPKPNRRRRFCLRGHDTHLCGRASNGGCNICDKIKKQKWWIAKSQDSEWILEQNEKAKKYRRSELGKNTYKKWHDSHITLRFEGTSYTYFISPEKRETFKLQYENFKSQKRNEYRKENKKWLDQLDNLEK